MFRTVRVVVVPVLCLGAVVSGCRTYSTTTSGPSFTAVRPVTSRDDLERNVSSALSGKFGGDPYTVKCPDSFLLLGRNDSTRCELTRGGARYGVTVTHALDDKDSHGRIVRYRYVVQVDDQPQR
ncbi:DUF4333 domain-containing protein [Gandjariella thermophila]|uniref:DUF4333 domain-containing protein n=1 Tax=Gandjariella thermophila TaxID=1931992 RepID=A0A4D4J7I5_9PSEU|nr:DUF4333 domain-containing protein [Gandjariella thermophila]GDY30628.1 hypothetical protein GTS_22610 [Gandjariella thermophila]